MPFFRSIWIPTSTWRRLTNRTCLQDWDAFPHLNATRTLGTQWFEEERSVVLSVPSAVLPVAKNFLINPFHPDFHALERGEPVPFSWDTRLFRRTMGGRD